MACRTRRRPRSSTIEKDHGRLETRRYTVVDAAAVLHDRAEWTELATVGWVEAERSAHRTDRGHARGDVPRGALLHLQPAAHRRPHCTRSAHALGIENGLHWVLDVVLDEDGQRARKDHGPENLAVLRRLALNVAKLEPSKGSMKGKLKRAGWDNAFLAHLLTQFASPQVR